MKLNIMFPKLFMNFQKILLRKNYHHHHHHHHLHLHLHQHHHFRTRRYRLSSLSARNGFTKSIISICILIPSSSQHHHHHQHHPRCHRHRHRNVTVMAVISIVIVSIYSSPDCSSPASSHLDEVTFAYLPVCPPTCTAIGLAYGATA